MSENRNFEFCTSKLTIFVCALFTRETLFIYIITTLSNQDDFLASRNFLCDLDLGDFLKRIVRCISVT